MVFKACYIKCIRVLAINRIDKYLEVHNLRKEKHLTIADACKKVGVSERTYKYWIAQNPDIFDEI